MRPDAKLPANRRRSTEPGRAARPRGALGRWGRRAAEVAVLAATVAGLVVLGRFTHGYVTTSPHFAVGEASVTGNKQVPAAEIQRLAGLQPGTNIFAVDLSEAARRIETNSWILSARVRRRLPSQLFIDVVERQAVAVLRLDELYLVDAEGTPFKRVGPDDPWDLPIITGVGEERLEDQSGARQDLAEALELLSLYEQSGLDRTHPLSEVSIESDGSLSLHTLETGTNVRLGRPPWRRKLRRLGRLFEELGRERVVADYVYLEEGDGQVQPDRAVVRLAR